MTHTDTVSSLLLLRNSAYLVFKVLIKDGMGEGDVEEYYNTRTICFSWAEQ